MVEAFFLSYLFIIFTKSKIQPKNAFIFFLSIDAKNKEQKRKILGVGGGMF